jgi:hypothetical protein
MSDVYAVGSYVLIRTVTYAWHGRIACVTPGEIVLEGASWVADTGPFARALECGRFAASEPVNRSVVVSRGAIVDCCIMGVMGSR